MTMRESIQKIVKITTAFRLLGDVSRYKILFVLEKKREGMCVNEIAEAVGLSPSATSHQLAKLEAHRVVDKYREGQLVCYVLRNTEEAKRIITLLRASKLFST